MPQSAPLPVGASALDDPRTRSAHVTAWQRGLVRLVTWTVVWLLLTLAVLLIDDRDLETVRAVLLLLMFASLRPLALASLSLQTVRAMVAPGTRRRVTVCTSCLKAGKVARA